MRACAKIEARKNLTNLTIVHKLWVNASQGRIPAKLVLSIM